MNIHCLYKPFFKVYRIRRLRLMASLFDLKRNETLLDVGGSPYFWALCKEIGVPVPRVTILNLGEAPVGLDPSIEWLRGDARVLPFDDLSFDGASGFLLLNMLEMTIPS
jgi:hypothetical protein